MIKVLFICVHNSARSQMAEELLRKMLGDRVDVQSAGLEPGTINPIVAELLAEQGIDISGKATKSVFDVFRSNQRFHYAITVCDSASGERCPIFPGFTKRLHWSFPDPSVVQGSPDEKREQVYQIMLMIQDKLNEFVKNLEKDAVI